jgi:transcriptional regulator with XRE-family HTH domain
MPEQMPVTQYVVARVKALRQARGWSVRVLAEQCTLPGGPNPQNAITDLERGRRNSATVDDLVALARALEVAPVDLLPPPDWEPGVSPPPPPEPAIDVAKVRDLIAALGKEIPSDMRREQ